MNRCVGAEEAREQINAALQTIDAAHAVLSDTNSDVVGNHFRVDVAERLKTQERTNGSRSAWRCQCGACGRGTLITEPLAGEHCERLG